MIKIETLEIAGFVPAMQALRLPFGKEPRSIKHSNFGAITKDDGCSTIWTEKQEAINDEDIVLASRLVKAGDCEAKVVRGIVVYTRILAPIYWWRELETYRHGHERLSCESTMHMDCRGLKGDELRMAKASIPMGYEQTAIDMFSYQCLRNIYHWRRNHRLPEWHEFCHWIETLPFAEQLIIPEFINENEQRASIADKNHQ